MFDKDAKKYGKQGQQGKASFNERNATVEQYSISFVNSFFDFFLWKFWHFFL
jgi:hypothetical protein